MNKISDNRQKYNRLILEQLKAVVEASPTERFGQILRNIDVVTEIRTRNGSPIAWENEFETESVIIYEKIKNSIYWDNFK